MSEQIEPPKGNTVVDLTKLWDLGKTILVLAIIPGIGWAVKIQIDSVILQQRVIKLESSSNENKSSLKELTKEVRKNTILLVKLGVILDAAIRSLEDTKRLLRERDRDRNTNRPPRKRRRGRRGR